MATEKIMERELTQDNFATEKIDVIKNLMFGDYNSDGIYVISSKIISELIMLKKYQTGAFSNSVFASAYLRQYGEVKFEILFKRNSVSKIGTAELYLLEDVDKVNGYFTNTIKTLVARYVEKFSDVFHFDALKLFNVSIDGEGEGKEIEDESQLSNEEDFKNIYSRKKLIDTLLEEYDPTEDKEHEKFFNKKLSLLKDKESLFGERVLSEFNKDYSKIEKHFFVDKKGKVKFKALNELLDKSIETVSGGDNFIKPSEEKYKEAIRKEIEMFSSKIDQKQRMGYETAVNKSLNTDKGKDVVEAYKERGETLKKSPTQTEVEKVGGSNVPRIKTSSAPQKSVSSTRPDNSAKNTKQKESNVAEQVRPQKDESRLLENFIKDTKAKSTTKERSSILLDDAVNAVNNKIKESVNQEDMQKDKEKMSGLRVDLSSVLSNLGVLTKATTASQADRGGYRVKNLLNDLEKVDPTMNDNEQSNNGGKDHNR